MKSTDILTGWERKIETTGKEREREREREQVHPENISNKLIIKCQQTPMYVCSLLKMSISKVRSVGQRLKQTSLRQVVCLFGHNGQ